MNVIPAVDKKLGPLVLVAPPPPPVERVGIDHRGVGKRGSSK